MALLRRPLLALANSQRAESLIRRNRLTRGLVRRFVAGEDLATALAVVSDLAKQGMTSTLDQLGENVAIADEAAAAVKIYIDILQQMARAGLEVNISVKLTMLGLDLGADLATENLRHILTVARTVHGFVRVDMEGSAYTERTIEIFTRLHDDYPDEVGIVIQAYLRRSEADITGMIERKARVRLVKGAYAEPASIAFPDKREVDANYAKLLAQLLEHGTYPAIATHDPALIRLARDHANKMGIGRDRFEFQMLYGVRRDEQLALTAAGYRMRIYVPYGTQWYPYFMRRIAERPANLFFVLRQFLSK